MVIENHALLATVLPHHGCMITELIPQGSGRNLLWARSNPPEHDLGHEIANGPAIDQFDESVFVGGWFAMFPLAGLPGAGDTERAMHGEIPRISWDVINRSPSSVTCRVRTPSGFEVQRVTELLGSTLRVRTYAQNFSGSVQEVTWGEHPCLDRAVFAGGRLSASVSRSYLTSEASEPDATRFQPGQSFTWPQALRMDGVLEDVTLIPAQSDGRHDHVCATLMLPKIEVTSPHMSGRIQILVDLKVTSELLFWQHFRPPSSPWNGDVFGIEVCSAPGRTFDDARAAGATTLVEHGQVIEWGMSMEWMTE